VRFASDLLEPTGRRNFENHASASLLPTRRDRPPYSRHLLEEKINLSILATFFLTPLRAIYPQNLPRLLADILQTDDLDLEARERTDPDLLTAVERTLIPKRYVPSGVKGTGF
jgi:hypothetical protein